MTNLFDGLVKVNGKDQAVAVAEVVGRAVDSVDPAFYDRFGQAMAAVQQANARRAAARR